MIIVPYETEARMLFGVLNMERLIEVAEARQQPFDIVRDVFWKNQEPAVKSSFLGMAQWCEQSA